MNFFGRLLCFEKFKQYPWVAISEELKFPDNGKNGNRKLYLVRKSNFLIDF